MFVFEFRVVRWCCVCVWLVCLPFSVWLFCEMRVSGCVLLFVFVCCFALVYGCWLGVIVFVLVIVVVRVSMIVRVLVLVCGMFMFCGVFVLFVMFVVLVVCWVLWLVDLWLCVVVLC